MGVKYSGRLVGPFDLELTHQDSGAVIHTTPPKDNGGEGNAFSPTDLAAASLGACAATTLALFARRNDIPLHDVSFEVEKLMHVGPRRLGKLRVHYRISSPCGDDDYAKLVNAARTCPVRLSLAEFVEVEETYERA